jgi:hypothetical protein
MSSFVIDLTWPARRRLIVWHYWLRKTYGSVPLLGGKSR